MKKFSRPGVKLRGKEAEVKLFNELVNPSTPGDNKYSLGNLPHNYLKAKDRNYTDEDWNDPTEQWAKVREDLGGDPVHIETWSGSGNKTRIITYPGTTNEDIKANSPCAEIC